MSVIQQSIQIIFIGILFSLTLAACGKDEAPVQPAVPGQPQAYPQPGQPQAYPQPGVQPTQPTPPTQPAAQPTPGQPQKPMAQNPMAGLMGALGAMQGQPPGQPAQVINWQSLSQALPMTAPGWSLKDQVKGETTSAMGVSVSNASCQLVQGGMTAKVEIIDTSMNPIIAMPFNMTRAVTMDSSEERVGPINFGTYPGTQKLDKKRNKAEVMVMVKNRILISVEVKNTTSEASAVGVAQYINFNHLAALVGG